MWGEGGGVCGKSDNSPSPCLRSFLLLQPHDPTQAHMHADGAELSVKTCLCTLKGCLQVYVAQKADSYTWTDMILYKYIGGVSDKKKGAGRKIHLMNVTTPLPSIHTTSSTVCVRFLSAEEEQGRARDAYFKLRTHQGYYYNDHHFVRLSVNLSNTIIIFRIRETGERGEEKQSE